jgi:DNA-binding response OmpR family regulator
MSEEAVSVLVVDDDPGVRELLNDYLSEHGFEVLQAESGNAMRALFAEHVPDVVLLDVRLPGEDGLSLARYVREHFDIGIVGLEVGADDYVTKPFDPRELRARLKTVLRRYRRPPAAQEPALAAPAEPATATRRVTFGRSLLDLDSHQLFDTGGEEIPITSMEFDLLEVFAERPNRPLSRDQLLNLTRNRDWGPLDRSIDIHIARLRRKVEPDPDRPRIIKTVRGVGYMYLPQGR